jgi:hypothetical protein
MSVNLTTALQNLGGRDPNFVDQKAGAPVALRQNGLILADSDTVTWDCPGPLYNTIEAAATATLPTATGAGQVLTSTGAGTTYTAQALPVGSATQGGIVEVDGTTITASGGVISAHSGMTLIQEIVLATSETSVTFSAIPQSFTNLRLICNIDSAEASEAALNMTFNGDTTTAHYGYIQSTGSVGSEPFIGVASTGVGINDITIPNYTSSFPKRAVGVGNDPSLLITTGMGWTTDGTGAITSITINTQNVANMLTGSTFSLYGLA